MNRRNSERKNVTINFAGIRYNLTVEKDILKIAIDRGINDRRVICLKMTDELVNELCNLEGITSESYYHYPLKRLKLQGRSVAKFVCDGRTRTEVFKGEFKVLLSRSFFSTIEISYVESYINDENDDEDCRHYLAKIPVDGTLVHHIRDMVLWNSVHML